MQLFLKYFSTMSYVWLYELHGAIWAPCNRFCCGYSVVGLDPAHRVVEEGDEVAGNAGDHGVDQTGHHERVVQEVLADDGSARAVEVHGGDIRRIVGDEEVAIDRGQHAQQDPAVDA